MLLTLGIALWAVAHLFVRLGADARAKLIASLGMLPYKGLFAVVIVAALVLIVKGWQAMGPGMLWTPPAGLRHATMGLMPLAVILFFSARLPTDIKQVIRHPQLSGVKLWAVAHLLSNGETRSMLLFGGLLAWAVVEVILINKRQGPRVKPPRVGLVKTTVSLLIGLLLTGVLMYAHPWFAGVAVMAHG